MSACTRCHFALEAEDLRCALCGLGVPHDDGAATATVRAEILRCTECGAAMAYSAQAGAPACAFCGAVTKLEALADPVDQARWKVPFAVDAATARAALTAWLGSRGFFRPSDLASASTVENLKPVWWPAWLFDARAEVHWTADSNAGAGRSAWAPHAGRCVLDFRRVGVSASRGLSDDECRWLLPGYDLATAVAMEQPGAAEPPGAIVERFDTQRSAARRRIAETIEATAAANVAERFVPGGRSRNVKVSVLVDGLSTERCALPAYVLAYRYRNGVYRVVVHGGDAQRVTGDAPLSWVKIAAVVLGAIALLAVVVAVVAASGGR